MPFTKDTRILASDFTSLRTAIKNEINARSYTGSIAGTFVDYTVDPAVIGIVQTEHYNKLVNGLKLINTTTAVSGLTKSAVGANDSILATDLALVDSKKTTFVNFDLTSKSSTDCSNSCTGGCYNDCYNGCTGCTGSCTGECYTTCTAECADNCTGSCTEACGSDGGCTSTCFVDCSGDCVSWCYVTCSTLCGTDGCSTVNYRNP